jgi:hypothetical protein
LQARRLKIKIIKLDETVKTENQGRLTKKIFHCSKLVQASYSDIFFVCHIEAKLKIKAKSALVKMIC